VRPVAPVLVLAFASTLVSATQQPSPVTPGSPVHTVDEYLAAARRILDDTHVPGAGIALVRRDAVEWEGGIGYADRDARTPVTAHTHFRLGSISKTFVALALVQLYEDDVIDLHAPVGEIAPDIQIENDWEADHPVTVLHLLQHTAGFDDTRFNEQYARDEESETPLEQVLQINPHSRRVRWPPGTRMAFSSPGYAVAARLIEKVTEEPYEEYIAREIFQPLQMSTSSFRLARADEPLLAQGYRDDSGPPTGFPRIYLRPAGNLHSSPHEMGRFVQMLLGWGELGDTSVVDPEFLGNMEQPQTTIAARAGLRNGYGSGIVSRNDLAFRILGHDGVIDGFRASYGYSPARDVGYVLLLNSSGPRSEEALQRLAYLTVQYLKRGFEPPQPPAVTLERRVLDRLTGYFHDANPRSQFAWPVQSLFAGRTIVRRDNQLEERRWFSSTPLIAVDDTTFRYEHEIDASIIFTTGDDGVMVMAGPQLFAERVPRWRIELVRVPVIGAVLTVCSVLVAAAAWLARMRRARPHGFWPLKVALLLCPLVLLMAAAGLALTPMHLWGARTPGTIAVFVASLAVPVLALATGLLSLGAVREGASRRLTTYAATVSLSMAILSLYLSAHGMLGVRTWTY
jgi:CubicO group peptidase (beta-lactamase class C family)